MKSFPKHILIDGADGLGKTTICQYISRKTGYPVVKMPNMKEYIEKGSAEEFSKLFNETIVQFSDYDFILDRGFTSSMVYNKHFKRDFNLDYLKNIRNILKPEIFILTGLKTEDPRFMGQREFFRGDEIIKPDDVVAIDQEFLKLANKEGFHVIEVWGRSPQEIGQIILDKINEQRQ